MLTKTWRDILETAQRAPSPHNVQPWKVRIVSEETCEVFIDTARTLPKEDVTGSFITSGMVMYLETMRYVAQTYQYDLQYELCVDQLIDDDGLQLFAKVVITPDELIAPEFERDIILRRRTSRLPYAPKLIAASDQAKLQLLAQSYGYEYGDMTDPSRVEQVLAQDIAALFRDFNTSSYHDEIVSWFRFTRRAAWRHKDGLDFRCMRVPAVEYYMSARFPRILRLPVLGSLFAERYRRLIGSTPCIAWISGPFWQSQDAVTAGKFLMHFWLELTRMGLYLHPFGNLVTNTTARSEFEALTGSGDVWFVVRIGYTDEPPESYRLPLEQILIEKDV